MVIDHLNEKYVRCRISICVNIKLHCTFLLHFRLHCAFLLCFRLHCAFLLYFRLYYALLLRFRIHYARRPFLQNNIQPFLFAPSGADICRYPLIYDLHLRNLTYEFPEGLLCKVCKISPLPKSFRFPVLKRGINETALFDRTDHPSEHIAKFLLW